jgi:hypothetical protein
MGVATLQKGVQMKILFFCATADNTQRKKRCYVVGRERSGQNLLLFLLRVGRFDQKHLRWIRGVLMLRMFPGTLIDVILNCSCGIPLKARRARNFIFVWYVFNVIPSILRISQGRKIYRVFPSSNSRCRRVVWRWKSKWKIWNVSVDN